MNKDWLLLQKLFWIKPCVHFIFRTTAWILAPNPISKRHAESFSSYNKLLKIKMNGPIDNLTDKMMDKKRDLDVSSKKPALSVGNLVPQTKYKSKKGWPPWLVDIEKSIPPKKKSGPNYKSIFLKIFFRAYNFCVLIHTFQRILSDLFLISNCLGESLKARKNYRKRSLILQ